MILLAYLLLISVTEISSEMSEELMFQKGVGRILNEFVKSRSFDQSIILNSRQNVRSLNLIRQIFI